jgi:hypothetical protein
MVKGTLFGLLVLSLVAVWHGRAWVTEPYRDRPEGEALRLSGVDLAYRVSDIEPSPYLVPAAPDTRDLGAASPIGPGTAPPPPPVSMGGGSTRLQGSVVGPDGPVAGALVHLERHTAGGVGHLDTSTDDEGRWLLQGLAGGRYRIRAWVPDQLTMGRSEVRYVADDEEATFEFSLWAVDPTPRLELVDGGPMYEGLPSTVAVFLGARSVDQEGVVVTNPLPGERITIVTTAQVQVLGQPFGVTDSQGAARFVVRCVPVSGTGVGSGGDVPPAPAPGQAAVGTDGPDGEGAGQTGPGPDGSLVVDGGGVSASFALPGCIPAPAPEPVGPADGADPTDAGGGGTDG